MMRISGGNPVAVVILLCAFGLVGSAIAVTQFVMRSDVHEPALVALCTGPVCDAPTFDSVEVGVFEATGYAIGPPYASIVKSGDPVLNKGFMTLGGIEIFTVAVDPRVIPLGSILWIEGLGIGMASDTGRLIKGRRIDVCFRTMDEAWRYGRRNINVVMLRKGGTR